MSTSSLCKLSMVTLRKTWGSPPPQFSTQNKSSFFISV